VATIALHQTLTTRFNSEKKYGTRPANGGKFLRKTIRQPVYKITSNWFRKSEPRKCQLNYMKLTDLVADIKNAEEAGTRG
jgi:hypothetical protein